jgi:hypothetical protein
MDTSDLRLHGELLGRERGELSKFVVELLQLSARGHDSRRSPPPPPPPPPPQDSLVRHTVCWCVLSRVPERVPEHGLGSIFPRSRPACVTRRSASIQR